MATDRLSAEQRAELARLDELVKPRVLGCETTHARVGPRGGRMLVGLITSAFPLSDGDFAYMTVDMSRLLSMARTHLRALLAAAEEAERLRERVAAANERARVLAEEVNAWRWWGTHELSEDMSNEATAVFDARDATDAAGALSASGVEVLARGRWYNTTENMPDSWQIGLVADPQAPPVKNMGVPCIVIRTDAAKALEGE